LNRLTDLAARLSRLTWLVALAIAVVVAACNNGNGSGSGY